MNDKIKTALKELFWRVTLIFVKSPLSPSLLFITGHLY